MFAIDDKEPEGAKDGQAPPISQTIFNELEDTFRLVRNQNVEDTRETSASQQRYSNELYMTKNVFQG